MRFVVLKRHSQHISGSAIIQFAFEDLKRLDKLV